MTDRMGDEIDGLVGRGEAPSPRPKKPRRPARVEDGGDEPETKPEAPSISSQEQDLRDLLPKELPQPVEKVKTLDEMVAKFRIGQDTQFRLEVYRLTPKFFPGGVQAHGYYDAYDVPLTQDMIASEYGGGQFRVKVMGPEPNNPTGWKQYDSHVVEIAGEPKYARKPRASQTADVAPVPSTQPAPFQQMGGSSEDPKLAQAALKMSSDLLDAERKERHRIEDRAVDAQKQAAAQISPLVELHKQRAEEAAQHARERADMEKKVLEDRLHEERTNRSRLEERISQMENQPRTSVADELGKLMQFLPKGDEGAGSQRMLEQVLDKQRAEMESVQKQHQLQLESMQKQSHVLVDSLRESHRLEQQSLRESHQRQMDAERESFRMREERAETVLAAEREERRRDREMFQRSEEQRDRQWKERLENQELNLKAQWESRLTTSETTLKTRIEWLQAEIDKKESEISDQRTRLNDNADPVMQFEKMSAFRDAAKNALGITDPPPAATPTSGGGIGMGGGDEWKTVLAEGAAERLPQIVQVGTALFERIMGGGAQPQQPQQQAPQYQLGQQFNHPQYGHVVVVQDPARQGQLGLQPFAQWQAQQQSGPPQMGSGRRTSGRGLLSDMDGMMEGRRQAPKKRGIIPNMSEGLPRQHEPGEPVHPPMPPMEQQRRTSRSQPQPQQQPQPHLAQPQITPAPQQHTVLPMPTQTAPETPSSNGMSALEKRVAIAIAQQINDAVMRGDEPEEFVEMALKSAPKPILEGVCKRSTDEVIEMIRTLAPQSAGATPAGAKFTKTAIRLLRQQLGIQ